MISNLNAFLHALFVIVLLFVHKLFRKNEIAKLLHESLDCAVNERHANIVSILLDGGAKLKGFEKVK